MTKIYQLIEAFFSDKKLYQYIGVGAIAASVDLSCFLTLNHLYSSHYLINNSIGFVIATLVNYLLCAHVVFKYTAKYDNYMAMFLTYFVSLIGWGIQSSFLWVGIEWLAIPMLIAKLLAMGSAFFWNFFSRKYWVFAQNNYSHS
jgi:putative flippase GtrA